MDVNPDVLVRIAEDNADQGAVPVLARLRAAEQWRDSAMKGYRPGGRDMKTGVINPDDMLTADGKKEFLEKAKAQYKQVIDQTSGNIAKATFTMTAYMGLAAVCEAQAGIANTAQLKDEAIAEAKTAYTAVKDLAEKANFPEYAALAKKRIETVEKFSQPVTLLPESMVASWDKPAPVPAPTPIPGGGLLSPSPLSTGQLTPGTAPLPSSLPDPFKIDTTIPGGTPTPTTNPAPGGEPVTPVPVPTPAPAPATEPKKDEPKKP
jgi:hypothetical protein